MGILSSFFGNSKKLPFNKTVKFKRVNSKLVIELGDELNIWNKPNSKILHLYTKGSSGGGGLVGTKSDDIISYHFNKTDNLFVENKVVGVSEDSIDLKVHLYVDNDLIHKEEQKYKLEWVDRINKKYNPKTSWELRFESESEIDKDNFIVQTITKDEAEEYYLKQEKAIWLTDKKGNKIPAENRTYSSGIEKTLRAVFSNHIIEVLSIKKENSFYCIEIGIMK